MPPQRQRVPADLTRFFGREAEIAQVSTLIDDGARLVTLTGLGGFGKSRLAREVARRLAKRDPGTERVAFCDVSDCTGIDDITSSVSAALGLAMTAASLDRDSLTALSTPLRQLGRCLLVLDGLEQAGKASHALLIRWLMDAEQLVILATHRERLGIPGEHACPLGPLALPVPTAAPAEAAAYHLFVDRMRAVGVPWDDTAPASQDAVAELVKRLDGNPLAIELAAARASLMSPQQLLPHMRKHYQLDEASPAIVEPALVAVIKTSWDGLSPDERLALCQLSVFSPSASLDAADAVIAEAIGADEGAGIAILQRLMDRSLVTTVESPWLGGVRRVALLDTIRAFVRARMSAGEVDATQCHDRHARWVEAFVVSLEPELVGVNARDARLRISAEVGNALAVFSDGMVPNASPEACSRALTVLLSVRQVLLTTRPTAQVIDYFDQAWRRSETLAPAVRARVGAQLGRVAAWAWPTPAAREVLLAAEAAADASGDPRVLAEVLVTSGEQAHIFSPVEAEDRLARACQALPGDTSPLAAWAYTAHGISLSKLGRHAASIGVFETARTMVEQLDAPLLRSMVNNNQGVALTAAGAWRDGEARYRDALSAARAAAALGHECTALRNLGECALALGEFERARPLLTEAIRLGESIGMDRVLAASTLMRASIDHATGNVPTAIAGYRAALACLERVHGDPAAQALNAIGLGIGLAESGDLEEGQRQLLEAKGYFEEVDDRVLDEALVMIRIRFAAITGERDANTAQAAIRASFQRAETLARAALSPHRLPYVRMAMLIAMRGQATPLAVEAQPADVEVLYIAADGNGFGHDGTWVALGRKANARRLLSLLATRRIDAPGTHVVLDDVFEAVWPGQRLDEPYRSNRVYVVVTQLRSAGLGGLLQHNGDGYLLCTARSVRLASAAEFAALES